MEPILEHPGFSEAFERMSSVSLNPRRHSARDGKIHSIAVAERAVELAQQNGCSAEEVALLHNLGLAHDVGKVTGTANPAKSVELLEGLGVSNGPFMSLVKWHDTNLPWWRSHSRGQAPSAAAWGRLSREVDMRLLCLFMVADRVDAPGGWRRNEPLRWFLGEAEARGLVSGLVLDSTTQPSLISAGAALVREGDGGPQVLVIRVRADVFELPKGGLKWDETVEEAAVRELVEETGIAGTVTAGQRLGHLDYPIELDGTVALKRVYYLTASVERPEWSSRPAGTRELRWVSDGELDALPLVNDELRPILAQALSLGS